ncbi:CLUMA_CG017771, isoform A [Clunio marinus]|uniref:CLUMA_CG017771, isoform A n=1 Tax=Clunio marinus TaxID=568069 RepID=A0A1J1IX33_9DIPT|nr:CLUMA_CG017771, isoform A [Clunio marinus]
MRQLVLLLMLRERSFHLRMQDRKESKKTQCFNPLMLVQFRLRFVHVGEIWEKPTDKNSEEKLCFDVCKKSFYANGCGIRKINKEPEKYRKKKENEKTFENDFVAESTTNKTKLQVYNIK